MAHKNPPEDSVGMQDIASGNNNNNSDLSKIPIWWRERINTSIARSRKIRGGNYVQLATVDPQSLEPRCRTVVFRGFQPMQENEDEESCVMKMITDARSSKVSELASAPRDGNVRMSNKAELVWWFSKSSEQYRIRGTVQLVGEENNEDHDAATFLQKARIQQWRNLSDPAREQFFWVDPGKPLTTTTTAPQGTNDEESTASSVPSGGRNDQGEILPPPSTFLLLLLYPHRVDYLRLKDNYRQVDERKQKEKEGMEEVGCTKLARSSKDGWIFEAVTP